jgi:hypothetical protein
MLYKYCDTKGFGILEKSSFRLKRFEDFNDPFELVFGIDEDSASINIKREYEENPDIIEIWKSNLDDHNIKFDQNSSDDILQKVIEFQIRDFNRMPIILREHWNNEMGIICLSESMDVIQMWAHYTENHKGIVIGIEESEFVNDNKSLVTVCYRDKMVLIPVNSQREKFDQNGLEYIREVIARKESKWSYEKEIRFYIELKDKDADGHYYFEIPASSIKEIYLGLRSSEYTKLVAKCIKQREEYQHLKIYQMVKDESAYKLNPEEILD